MCVGGNVEYGFPNCVFSFLFFFLNVAVEVFKSDDQTVWCGFIFSDHSEGRS